MVSCEKIREKEKLERSVYLHGMLPLELLGKPSDILKKITVKLLGKQVEVIDLTQGYGLGSPLWPYFEDISIERMHYHAKSRVLTQWIHHPMHVATHADAPIHVEEEYPTIDEVPIERYMGEGVIVDIPKGKWEIITPEDLENAQPSIEKGDIVIIHTGWHRFWGDNVKYFVYSPGLYKEAAEWLVKKGVKAVGVDNQALDHPLGTRIVQPPPLLPWVIEEYKKETGRDVYQDFPYWEPAHRILLTNGVMGWENVGGDIDKVVGKRCTIIGLPTKWISGDGANVRLIAISEKR
ncbi:MAG: cyclase family protein [Candidatus Bathyarchaeia archaeon]